MGKGKALSCLTEPDKIFMNKKNYIGIIFCQYRRKIDLKRYRFVNSLPLWLGSLSRQDSFDVNYLRHRIPHNNIEDIHVSNAVWPLRDTKDGQIWMLRWSIVRVITCHHLSVWYSDIHVLGYIPITQRGIPIYQISFVIRQVFKRLNRYLVTDNFECCVQSRRLSEYNMR